MSGCGLLGNSRKNAIKSKVALHNIFTNHKLMIITVFIILSNTALIYSKICAKSCKQSKFFCLDNFRSSYKKSGEVKPNVQGIKGEIISDMTTSFTILLAIFFPSVTGLYTSYLYRLYLTFLQIKALMTTSWLTVK